MWVRGGGGEKNVKSWNEKKEKEMRVPSFKVFGLQGRKEMKKKSSWSIIDSLFSLFPSNLGGKENVDPMENSAFSFPSFHFSPNK